MECVLLFILVVLYVIFLVCQFLGDGVGNGDDVLLSSHICPHRLDILYSGDIRIGKWVP